MPAKTFLKQYWQRRALVIRDVWRAPPDWLDGNDLGGLACEPDVDCRIVSTLDQGTDADGQLIAGWQCETGPFAEHRLTQLPTAGWTLLVEAVDHWIEDVASLRSQFGFLARWRLDDVMMSYAAPGGGVGPHFDFYDVFLLQTSGRREWKLGQRCNAETPIATDGGLRLLEQFETQSVYQLNAGDMLYVPAGVAHWGTATSEDCMTCSIGFRAPAHAEIVEASAAEIAVTMPADARYADPNPSQSQRRADPYVLGTDVAASVAAVVATMTQAKLERAAVRAFGKLVTEPRAREQIEPLTATDFATALAAAAKGFNGDQTTLASEHCWASRFAYHPLPNDQAWLFVDGECLDTSLEIAQAACLNYWTPALLRDAPANAVLEFLCLQGAVVLRSPEMECYATT